MTRWITAHETGNQRHPAERRHRNCEIIKLFEATKSGGDFVTNTVGFFPHRQLCFSASCVPLDLRVENPKPNLLLKAMYYWAPRTPTAGAPRRLKFIPRSNAVPCRVEGGCWMS